MLLASLTSGEREWREIADELAPELRVSPLEVERRIRNRLIRPGACPTFWRPCNAGRSSSTAPIACYARVDAMARALRWDGENRTLDQLRADITADLLLGRDSGAHVPEAAAMVYLHLPIDTALSTSETGCELDGYGPIPAAIAREIMTNSNSTWRAVLCDPATGRPTAPPPSPHPTAPPTPDTKTPSSHHAHRGGRGRNNRDHNDNRDRHDSRDHEHRRSSTNHRSSRTRPAGAARSGHDTGVES
ncbi:hypothetical protein LY12_001713 [Prauserella alba]|uniref:DUF222 domain-containing protein n=1 Tax=Prauserella alba TaxID=176898 RepID=A0ABN1V300_9PSEU|nr:hypothetical protein [Prauserella alba]